MMEEKTPPPVLQGGMEEMDNVGNIHGERCAESG